MVALGSEPLPWLRPLSWVYGLGVRARNLSFSLGLRSVQALPVPVVSVGNLSVGGTGKTPLVAWLVERYHDSGLRVGVLARGYARGGGERLNDEGRLLARRYAWLPQEQDGDRFAAGERLLAAHELDLVLLDDGFQHRRLHRDLDVCLVDAARPLGGGLLPSGWLREPASALQRADVLVLANVQDATRKAIDLARDVLREYASDKPVVACNAAVQDLVELPGGRTLAPDTLAGADCVLLAAIARPERFRASVERHGGRVVATEFLRDHTPIPGALLSRLAADAERGGRLLVTTEKDEARLDLPAGSGPKRHVLRIGLQFEPEPELALFLPAGVEPR